MTINKMVRTALATSLVALASVPCAGAEQSTDKTVLTFSQPGTADSVPLIPLLGLIALCIALVLTLFRRDEYRL